jgi:hypothetical protein
MAEMIPERFDALVTRGARGYSASCWASTTRWM